jgi:PRD1 phage membrane DNA delivery
MNSIGPTIITIVCSVIGLAIIAVVVSKNAQTPAVLTGAGTALSGIIGAAVGPVSNSQGNNFGSSGASGVGSVTGGPIA